MTRFSRRLVLAIPLVVACRSRRREGGAIRRVVSIAPATTEALFAVGAGPLVVGRSQYCDFPPEVRALPSVGGVTDPSFEAILALAPDLVVGSWLAPRAIVDRLGEKRIGTYFPHVESFAEIDAMIGGIAERVARPKEGAEVIAKMHADRERIARAVAGRPTPRVLFVVGASPIFVAGPGSFADEVLRAAGGINAMRATGAGVTAWPSIDIEQVIALDPDVVLDASASPEHGAASLGPGWNAVRAFREGKIIPMKDEIVLRPGPRVAEGIAQVARAIHPGALP